MTEHAPVLIVGAGPVGLTLACFLTHHGVPVKVVDSKPGTVTESRALGVHARTLELLAPLGLDERFMARGRSTRWMDFHRHDRTLFSLSFDTLAQETRYPFYLILPQSETEALLCDWLARHGVSVQWSTELRELSVDATGPTVELETADGAVRKRHDYVVGCDGAGSRVRAALDIGFDGITYDAQFMLSEVRITEDALRTDATHVYLADNTVVAAIPMPSGAYRIVGPNSAGAQAQGAGAIQFSEFRQFLSSNGLFPALTMHSPSRVMAYRMHKRVANRFHEGRVFLAGDAAHIHSPAGGQGMNTGMQDAINLAWKLAAVVKHEAPPAVFETYERERREIATRVAGNTDKAMSIVTSKSPWTRLALRWLAPALLRWYVPRRLMRGLSQLDIDYAPNAGQDAAPAIRSGFRLPWFNLRHRLDTYDLLPGTGWTLLLAAEPHELDPLLAPGGPLETLQRLSSQGLRVAVIQSNRYFRRGDALPPPWLQILPDEGHALATLSANGARAVLVRPDAYVLATSRDLGLQDCLEAMLRFTDRGEL
jgi:2-polyprenyl-6-methoxyphenol hydroxylase-like FAD-dependent oxidoreductase